MTDREMLELAAKAAGHEVWTDIDGNLYTTMNDLIEKPWNPLIDDGDALRLAAAVGMESVDVVIDEWPDHNTGIVRKQPNMDATRRAIVLAAAEMGRNME